MPRITRTIRTRREDVRSRRAIEKAIANAGSPGLRDELIYVAQRNGGLYGR